jgi:hypothetical protein
MWIWVIYDHPSDFPDEFVARRWIIIPMRHCYMPTADFYTAKTLDDIRARLPKGLTRLPRQDDDDVVIVETWV